MTRRLENLAFGAVLMAAAGPAHAGDVVQTPAPAIGVGIGAVVLIGAGYRALKARIK